MDDIVQPLEETLRDADNQLFLFPMSIWEVLILIEKKRIQVNSDPVTEYQSHYTAPIFMRRQ